MLVLSSINCSLYKVKENSAISSFFFNVSACKIFKYNAVDKAAALTLISLHLLNNFCVASTCTVHQQQTASQVSPMLQFIVRSGTSFVNAQKQQPPHVTHVHKAAAAHLAPIPESAVAAPASDQEVVVTSCSRRCPLLSRATELITSFVSHQSCLNFCIYFSDYSMKTVMTSLNMLNWTVMVVYGYVFFFLVLLCKHLMITNQVLVSGLYLRELWGTFKYSLWT